jgi:hypothetical protein
MCCIQGLSKTLLFPSPPREKGIGGDTPLPAKGLPPFGTLLDSLSKPWAKRSCGNPLLHPPDTRPHSPLKGCYPLEPCLIRFRNLGQRGVVETRCCIPRCAAPLPAKGLLPLGTLLDSLSKSYERTQLTLTCLIWIHMYELLHTYTMPMLL